MNNSLKKIVISLFAIATCATAAFAWNPSDEVLRLNKEVPSFETFGNPAAVIWLRNQELKQNNDGSVDICRYYIINFGEKIPDKWREYKAVAPIDGEFQITHAAIYNPMNGMADMKLDPEVRVLPGGVSVHCVSIPDAARGRAVVITEQERRTGSKGLDETVSFAEEIPVWEQKIAIAIPQKNTLYWFANMMREPQIVNSGNEKVYFWEVMNQPAWRGTGLVISQKPAISFSSEAKLQPVLEAMQKKVEDYSAAGISPAARDAKAAMKWFDVPERRETNLPDNMIRPVRNLPKQGPWTRAESTILLGNWLEKAGSGTKIWWQSPTVLTADNTVAEDFWKLPVIVRTEGKKNVYYHCGQGVEYGEVSPFLSGTDLYRAKTNGIDHKEVKAGNPANHKLSMLWNLKIAESGTAEGTLSAIIDGAWAGIFSNGIIPKNDISAQLLFARINFAIPGMTLTPVSVQPRTSGYKMDFKVRCVPGISQKNNLLVRLPGGVPEILGELINQNDSYTFRFPFIIEQKVRMSTPKGYKLFQSEVTRTVGQRKNSKLIETIKHNDVRNNLEADCSWTVKKLKVDMEDANELKQQLGEFVRWPVLNLPFRKK